LPKPIGNNNNYCLFLVGAIQVITSDADEPNCGSSRVDQMEKRTAL